MGIYMEYVRYIPGWWCKHTILKNDGVRQWVLDAIPAI